MVTTLSTILREITDDYLDNIDVNNPPTPKQIEQEIFDLMRSRIAMENTIREKGEKLRLPNSLSFSQIAAIMARLYPIVRVSFTEESTETDADTLAIYQEAGENEGIYVTSEDEFRRIATQYDYNLRTSEFEEVLTALRTNCKEWVPRKLRNNNPNLIAVNNGIFNYETKQLMPFSPDYVFMCKSHVDYNPQATNITIHNDEDGTDWDVETWMAELTDDPEITQLLWEIIGAIIRPHQRWGKSAWFYSESGNNGKGTLCELMRNICGKGAYTSIPIADFAKDFMLEPLIRTSAIIVDENDVGTYVDKVANLKAVITNDTVQINRKFRIPIAYQFFGFSVQCVNEFPRIKDKSDSFGRRMLIVPFNKSFTGHERKYIKNNYLHRKEVLEYCLYKVLNMNYDVLSEPKACTNALNDYKTFNNPVKEFLDEILDQFTWDLVPFQMLYALYQEWYRRVAPTGTIQGRNTFINDVVAQLKTSDKWYCIDKSAQIKASDRMDKPEPLILQYNLKDWMNNTYHGSDPNVLCTYPHDAKQNYRGILRYINGTVAQQTTQTDDTDDTDKPFDNK